MSTTRRAVVAALAVLGTVLSLLALGAGPASSAAAATLTSLPASSQVGTTLTLGGTAPPGAVVTVQRRYGSGAFARIGSARATRGGSWSLRTRLARGGTTSFRALSGGRSSAVRTLKVYQWLNVVDQPFDIQTGGFGRYDVTSRIGGTSLARSIEVNDLGYLAVNTAGLCTRLQLTTGVEDRDRPGRDGDEFAQGEVERFDPDGYVGGASVPFGAFAGDGAVRVTVPLTSGARTTRTLAVRFLADDPDDTTVMRAVLGSPRVLCNTTRLPELARENFPD